VGVGDPYGMHAAHAIVSGIGGIRTAGDLVARLQLNRSMKIDAAKKYSVNLFKHRIEFGF
jgi:dimethylamine--corrinoid protein Co-methyltransferase